MCSLRAWLSHYTSLFHLKEAHVIVAINGFFKRNNSPHPNSMSSQELCLRCPPPCHAKVSRALRGWNSERAPKRIKNLPWSPRRVRKISFGVFYNLERGAGLLRRHMRMLILGGCFFFGGGVPQLPPPPPFNFRGHPLGLQECAFSPGKKPRQNSASKGLSKFSTLRGLSWLSSPCLAQFHHSSHSYAGALLLTHCILNPNITKKWYFPERAVSSRWRFPCGNALERKQHCSLTCRVKIHREIPFSDVPLQDVPFYQESRTGCF